MANTTDLMITSFFDDNAIEYINKETGLGFKKLSDGGADGGAKVLSFESFGTCPRSIGMKKINQLIDVFNSAPFEYPEYAVLLIDDDNDNFNGIVVRSN